VGGEGSGGATVGLSHDRGDDADGDAGGDTDVCANRRG